MSDSILETTPGSDAAIKYRDVPESSNITKIGWDPVTQEMRVVFKGASTYRYKSVPGDVVARLLYAASAGSFFAGEIKGRFAFEKVVEGSVGGFQNA